MQTSIVFYLQRVLALLAAMLASLAITHWMGGQAYPIGWIYIALFVLAGLFAFIARGTYMWVAAIWTGAMLMVIFGNQVFPGDRWLSSIVIGVQYLSAVLTGGLLGQWLRYQYARFSKSTLPLIPETHMLLVSGAFLLVLPLLAFLMLTGMTIQNKTLETVLMFVPGNTPFLFPALLASMLCGYWVRRLSEQRADRNWAMLLILLSLLLLLMAVFIKLVFGFLQLYPVT